VKRYYSEYVRHCLRFYVMTLNAGSSLEFKSQVDKANWSACHAVVSTLNPQDVEVVRELYGPGDTIPDKIYALSKAKRTSQDQLWNLVTYIEFKIAQERGLISCTNISQAN
jgi:hypothetical protein